MDRGRCETCPVPPGSPCLGETSGGVCGRAAREGEGAFRASLVRRAASFPPLHVQAGNLAGAVGRFIAGGVELATEEERERRLSICRSNECGRFAGGRCAECGCRLSWKASMLGEHCPLPEPYW